jgi:hypothetical protein
MVPSTHLSGQAQANLYVSPPPGRAGSRVLRSGCRSTKKRSNLMPQVNLTQGIDWGHSGHPLDGGNEEISTESRSVFARPEDR